MLCLHAKLREKPTAFCGLCRKDKKMSRTKPFQHQFLSFYTRHKKRRFFLERLCKHIEYRDVCANIFVYFNISQCF
jgi:hypothetical protein